MAGKMYICNCNGINEKEVLSAIKLGAIEWDDVHKFYGRTPDCGKCKYEIKQAILNSRTGNIKTVISKIISPSSIKVA